MRFPVPTSATLVELSENGDWILPNARSNRQLEVLTYLSTLIFDDFSDELEWWPGNQKQLRFCTGDIYNLLRPHAPVVSWHKEVWFSGGIPKHMFLTWLMVRNRCPTRDRLLSWGLQTDSWCLLCNRDDESISHCFFECGFAWEIWKTMAAKYNFHSPIQWMDLLLQLKNQPINKTQKTLLLLCWQATLYTLWTERNNRLHNARFTSTEGLLASVSLTVRNRISSLRIDRPKLCSSLLQLWFST